MADHDYGRESGDYRERGARRGRNRSEARGEDYGNWDDESLEERAFGGYPDYREERRQRRGDGGVFRGRAGGGGRYGSPNRDSYPYESRNQGGYDAEQRYGEERYPQEERGDDWSRRGRRSSPDRYADYGQDDQMHHGGQRSAYRHGDNYRSGREERGRGDYGQGEGYTAGGYGYGEGSSVPGRGYGDDMPMRGSQQWSRNQGGGRGYQQHGHSDWSEGHSAEQADHDEFEPDYLTWRQEQMKALDDDYRAYRGERRKKFSEDFESYRKNKTKSGSSSSSSGSSSSGGSNNSTKSS